MNRTYLVLALMLVMVFLAMTVPLQTLEASTTPNSMSQPTPEQRQRAQEKIALSNKYCELKYQGRAEEALAVLKTLFPYSKTTVADIELSLDTGENQLPDFSIEIPCTTQAPDYDPSLMTNFSRYAHVNHFAQEKSYYCGPASVRSIISNQTSYPPSQTTLADPSNLDTDALGQTGFDKRLENTLNRYMNANYEIVRGDHFNAQGFQNSVVATIDAGYPILANGISGGNTSYIEFPWYPVGTYHFVAIYGYSDDGVQTWVCDPAANANLPGFETVIPKYGLRTAAFFSFILPRGIVY